jgi:hypothetical protein
MSRNMWSGEQNTKSLLAAWFMLISFLRYYSDLKMEDTSSSETSFDFQEE